MSDCFFIPVENASCGFTEDLRFLDTDKTTQERELFSFWFYEEIQKYGIKIEYIKNRYQLSAHNSLYGEHTTKTYDDPIEMISFVVLNQDSVVLNKFGIESDGDITAFIHISSFKYAFGNDSEPLAGDLIRLTEYGGTNRPNGRGAAMFEITRRDDEELNVTNPLMGHYVWLLRGKRYDYSYEKNVDPELLINQVSDDVIQSLGLTGIPQISSVKDNIEKLYSGSADETGLSIFNYD